MAESVTAAKLTLGEVVSRLGLTDAGGAAPAEGRVTGGYCSDLLSDVMGNSREGEVWVTIQSHMNVVAVAALKELAAVVICGPAQIEQDVLAKAREENVVLLRSRDSAFEVCGKLWDLGVRRGA